MTTIICTTGTSITGGLRLDQCANHEAYRIAIQTRLNVVRSKYRATAKTDPLATELLTP